MVENAEAVGSKEVLTLTKCFLLVRMLLGHACLSICQVPIRLSLSSQCLSYRNVSKFKVPVANYVLF